MTSVVNDVAMDADEKAKFEAWCAAENDDWEAQMDRINRLGEEIGIVSCCYSMGSEEKLLKNELFAEGKVRIDYDGGWGTAVTGEVLTDPTYQDVWKAADVAVRMSGDGHHVFLEIAKFSHEEDGVKVYSLWFGS